VLTLHENHDYAGAAIFDGGLYIWRIILDMCDTMEKEATADLKKQTYGVGTFSSLRSCKGAAHYYQSKLGRNL